MYIIYREILLYIHPAISVHIDRVGTCLVYRTTAGEVVLSCIEVVVEVLKILLYIHPAISVHIDSVGICLVYRTNVPMTVVEEQSCFDCDLN